MSNPQTPDPQKDENMADDTQGSTPLSETLASIVEKTKDKPLRDALANIDQFVTWSAQRAMILHNRNPEDSESRDTALVAAGMGSMTALFRLMLEARE